MAGVSEAYEWRDRDVVDRDGEKIGTIQGIYLDADTGQPEWATVRTGLLGMKENFVPLSEAEAARGKIVVPYSKDQVKDAPSIDPDEELTHDEEATLYSHYGREYAAPSGEPAGKRETDDAMTRSEEEVRVGTAQRQRGRARLRKYVVTEEVEQTVPVQREEVRVEREPITDENVDEALAGSEISEDEHEVVLHEEEPVVEKRTIPKERVRMTKETQTDEETVSEDVRKERIEVEGDK